MPTVYYKKPTFECINWHSTMRTSLKVSGKNLQNFKNALKNVYFDSKTYLKWSICFYSWIFACLRLNFHQNWKIRPFFKSAHQADFKNAKIFEKSLFLVEILPSKPLKSCSSHFGKYLSLAIGKSQIRVISTSFSLWIFTSTLLAVLTRLKLQY